MMVDVPLIMKELRRRGYNVTNAVPLSENAGEYEFEIDGRMLVLAEVNALLDTDPEETPLGEQHANEQSKTIVNGLPDTERKS